MESEELVKKVHELYITSSKSLQDQAKELHLGVPSYKKILDSTFPYITVTTRQEAWELVKKYPDELIFYRMMGETAKSGKIYLLSLVMSNEGLKNLVENSGMSAKKIADKVNMPFVTESFIHDRTNRLKFKYSKEAIKRNREEALRELYKDKDSLDSIKHKRRDTMVTKYGADNPMRVESIKKKQRETTMTRYGVPVSTMSKAVQKKQQATSLKNNGVPFPAQNKEIYAKVITTNNERYGAGSYLLTKEGQETAKRTMVIRYGVGSPLELERNRELARQAIYNKYGSYTSFSSAETREKATKTLFKNYGVYHPMASAEIKEKFSNTMVQKYGYTSNLSRPEIRMLSYESRVKSINFTQTPYVTSVEESIRLLNDTHLLQEFLSSTFPDKESFTLYEVACILGRDYNTIKSILSTAMPFIAPATIGNLPLTIKLFIESLGYQEGKDFIVNDRQSIKPLEIDFYFPKQKVGIEVNDLATHNSTINPFGGTVKPKDYHKEKSDRARERGIRLIHAWEQYFNTSEQYDILKNAIKHALGLTPNKVYARNTYVKELSNLSLKNFFNDNNIQGFRGANRAYALLDKKTDEVLMAYSVGSSHFSHNKYDLEIIRGASKLDTTVVGGASKLWKYIIDNNPEVNSIVYYIDRNIYSGSSLWSLEGNLELVTSQVGFWNYFVDSNEIKNRQPSKHKEIKELVQEGKVWEVYNAGTDTYVWTR